MAVEISEQQQQLVSLAVDTAVVGLSAARRCLFGPVNHEENRQFLEEWSARLDEQCQSRWNFNFKSEFPLPGRYDWEAVENSPLADFTQRPKDTAGETPTGTGDHRVRGGMRTILKKRVQQESTTSPEEKDAAKPKGDVTPEKVHSITNYEYLPFRLRKALLAFQAEAGRINSSPENSTESTAVQCNLPSSSAPSPAVSTSSTRNGRGADGQPAAAAALDTEAERIKSSSSNKADYKLKRKQSTVLGERKSMPFPLVSSTLDLGLFFPLLV